MTILTQIFEICIIPLLGILTAWICSFISAKIKEKEATTDNEVTKKYLEMLNDTIINCIQATNQTYVNSLKASCSFDAEAQKIAFEKTFNAIFAILSTDAIDYLTQAIGDLDTYVTEKIEAEIAQSKKKQGQD